MMTVLTGKAAAVTVVCAGLHSITTTLVPIGWLSQIERIELSSLSMFLNTNRRRYRTRIGQPITLGRGSAWGLCLCGDNVAIGGSSPSTVSAYSLATGRRISSINISKDIRNCIHGFEAWSG
jgi:hypothetical protein